MSQHLCGDCGLPKLGTVCEHCAQRQRAIRRGLIEAVALLDHLIEEKEMAEGPHPDEVTKRFTYHPPRGDQPAHYQELRARARDLAMLIIELVPTSREQSLALTNLEQAIFWANAGIARRTPA